MRQDRRPSFSSGFLSKDLELGEGFKDCAEGAQEVTKRTKDKQRTEKKDGQSNYFPAPGVAAKEPPKGVKPAKDRLGKVS